MDSAIFHPYHDKVVEESKQCKKEQIIKDEIINQMKKKDFASQDLLSVKIKEIDGLKTENFELNQDLKAEEKKIESYKVCIHSIKVPLRSVLFLLIKRIM